MAEPRSKKINIYEELRAQRAEMRLSKHRGDPSPSTGSDTPPAHLSAEPFLSGTATAGDASHDPSARFEIEDHVALGYVMGVLLPLVLTVTSPWWWWSVGPALGAPELNTPGVAWMLAAGWVPWGVSLGMAMLLAVRLEPAREREVPGTRGWNRTAWVLVIVTGGWGALFSVTLLGIASMFGHPGAPPMGP
jgi:hypothetical protein